MPSAIFVAPALLRAASTLMSTSDSPTSRIVESVPSASSPKTPSRALGCFFLPFLGLGLFFTVMVIRGAIASAATYNWQSAPCRILESNVLEANEPLPWFAYLRYQSPTGESVRSSRTFGTYRDALRFVQRWPEGSAATCYLNPGDPAGALLERKGTGLVLLLFLPIPLFFVFIGAAGFASAVFRWQPRRRPVRPISPIAGRRFAAAVLVLLGLGLFTAFLLGPVRRAMAARSWLAHECTILRSEVRRFATSRGSDSYTLRLLYSYLVEGREHRSDTYSLLEFSDSGAKSAQRIVSAYRPRSVVTCYVNRADADEATLNRDPSLAWLVGLLPLGLIAWGRALWPRRNSIDPGAPPRS